MFASLCSLLLTGSAVLAADFGVPLTWTTDDTTLSYSERVQVAQEGIDVFTPSIDTSVGQFKGLGYWQSANAWSSLAQFDHIVSSTDYQDDVINNLNTVWSLFPNFDQYQYNDDSSWWATAAYYGYRSYGDGNLLQHAMDTWDLVSQYQITPEDAATGTHPLKDFSLAGTCNGTSMAGGVFWRNTPDDTSVNAITTGLFMTLSAYLAELTDNSTYTAASIAAGTWIQAQDYDPSDDLVLDTVDGHDCTRSPTTELFTYNSGKFIEGLSVLADVTGDPQWIALLNNTLAAATKSNAWQGENGIITEGADPDSDNDDVGFKSVFIRGLYEAFERSTNNDLRILVHSYVDVQYNALLDLAGSNNTYSPAWAGPPPSALIPWGQMAALDVLNSAIGANSN